MTYRLESHTELSMDNYPDFMPIAEDIQNFLANYANETDYWEILNRQIAQRILDRHPQISGIQVKFAIQPYARNNVLAYSRDVFYEDYARHSRVTIVRPDTCPWSP